MQRFFFFSFLAVTTAGGQVTVSHFCACRTFNSVQGEWSYQVLFMVRHPRGSYIATPLLSLEVATPENIYIIYIYIYSTLSSVCKKVRLTSGSYVGRTQLSPFSCGRPFHLTARLVLAMSAWSVKTRRPASRHCSKGCEGLWSYDYGHA